jgi:hypothetical protein
MPNTPKNIIPNSPSSWVVVQRPASRSNSPRTVDQGTQTPDQLTIDQATQTQATSPNPSRRIVTFAAEDVVVEHQQAGQDQKQVQANGATTVLKQEERTNNSSSSDTQLPPNHGSPAGVTARDLKPKASTGGAAVAAAGTLSTSLRLATSERTTNTGGGDMHETHQTQCCTNNKCVLM